MKKLITIICLLMSFSAYASELSNNEKMAESVVFISLAMDAQQTLDIKNHPELRETNPILGSHPSDVKIGTYFIVTGYAHEKIAEALPHQYRAAWQYGWAVAEIVTIIRNRKIGLRFNF